MVAGLASCVCATACGPSAPARPAAQPPLPAQASQPAQTSQPLHTSQPANTSQSGQKASAGSVRGTLSGKPFKCDSVMWNSYSYSFKQNNKRYAKVVVNMMESRKRFFGMSFSSETHKNTQIFVYTRASMKDKVVEKRYTVADGCTFKVVLEPEHLGHVVPGSISLRLPDGSSIAGQFVAVKAPRMIWDDEVINP